LPYWNYFGSGGQFNIPTALTVPQLPPPPPALTIALPNPTPNPLLVSARYGPDGNGTVYVPTPDGIAAHPHDPNFVNGPVTDDCLGVGDFVTGGVTGFGFGGDGPPQFLHFGQDTGDIENNPHNLVHVYVGGSQDINGPEGLMSDPGLAAIDPVFYLHHANVDRMWAIWNSGHANPVDPGWTAGPTDQGFVMPMPDPAGSATSVAWPYTPADVATLGLAATNYTYDDLPAPPPAPSPADSLALRLTALGRPAAPPAVRGETVRVDGPNTELVGASQSSVAVKGAGARATVALNPQVRERVSASLRAASVAQPPDRVYLAIENVRGTKDSSALNVYVNLPDGANPNDHPDLLAGTAGLFGLRRASSRIGEHGGQGLSFTFDITAIVDRLHLNQALNTNSIHVAIIPHRPLPEASDITVGRVSVYRRGR
jgi:tyrosinase